MKLIEKLKQIQAKFKNSSDGFTIVELMIALSIMAVILVMSTLILIQIGGVYDKGVSTSNLQNTTRGLVSDISSAIEFSGYNPSVASCSPSYCMTNGVTSDPYPGEYAYCMGTVRYSFILNTELGTDIGTTPVKNTPYVLWRDNLTNYTDPCVPVNFAVNPNSDQYTAGGGYEMMGNHTRLTSFSITPVTDTGTYNTYDITISSAFGDSDLLNLSGINSTCKSQFTQSATQFCSTSTYSGVVSGKVY